MCGRYGLLTDTQAIAEAFNAELGEGTDAFEAKPSYNIAPQTFQPVIRLNEETGKRELMMMRWGLVPFWSKDAQIGLTPSMQRRRRSPPAQRTVRRGNVEGCLCQPGGSMSGRSRMLRRSSPMPSASRMVQCSGLQVDHFAAICRYGLERTLLRRYIWACFLSPLKGLEGEPFLLDLAVQYGTALSGTM